MRGPSGITAIAAGAASNFTGYCAAASASGEVFDWAGTDHSYMPPTVQMRVRGRPRARPRTVPDPRGPFSSSPTMARCGAGARTARDSSGRGGPTTRLDVGAVGGLPAIADVVYGWCWAVALDRYGGVWEWGTYGFDPRTNPVTPQKTL